jgi:AGCS family alanine or glycine:cation symporter
MYDVFGVPRIVIGAIFALIAFAAMLKGRSGILSLTEKLVPLMTAGFVLVSLAVILRAPASAADAISKIFIDAFNFRSGVAGVSGFLLSGALRYGTMRGILSNEAGCGTAPAAHAVSNCDEPARQGIWGIFEVFVDTILLCTLTAIVIIMGYSATDPTGDYMIMTVDAYEAGLGSIAGYFIAVSVLLFGLATVLCWAHYGREGIKYFSKKESVRGIYIVLYTLSVLLGAVLSTEPIWQVADLSIGVMTVINLLALLLLSREVKQETEGYFERTKKNE